MYSDIPPDTDAARVYGTPEFEARRYAKARHIRRNVMPEQVGSETRTAEELLSDYAEISRRLRGNAAKPAVIAARAKAAADKAHAPVEIPAFWFAPPSGSGISDAQAHAEQHDWLILNRRITCADIIDVVCRHFGVTRVDLLSQRRPRSITRPRHIAFYLAKTLTLQCYPEIGRRFGGRDHTTIMHAVNKIAAQIETDDALKADIVHLRRVLGVGE